ncbi:hypothetical protein [Pseudomonas songnenensis]|uniref:Uncharacterized protein n=1 Tax=Pseudomonas songnenensis TaxID=1176259 RepID=A0ABX9UQQ9_9PSED|nr:hypothetical protein [Pseudomonas songnenensis]RMH95437.1 hypothetical protein EA798_16750 [Pseudomonas songnenensis]
MSWFGDLGNFEVFNLKGMANQVKDNPARLLYGSADPFSTKVWNKILGRDDKPLIDQWGGAADHRYEEAEDAGINTGAGKTGHGIARAIASFYTGGAAAGAMGGGAGAASGAGTAGGSGGLLGSTGTTAGTTGFGLGQPLASGTVGNASIAGSQGGGLLGSTAGTGGGFLQTGKQYMDAAKPYMDAAQTGMSINNQMQQANQPQPIQAAEVMQAQGGPQALQALASQGQQAQMAQLQSAEQARQQRRLARRGMV